MQLGVKADCCGSVLLSMCSHQAAYCMQSIKLTIDSEIFIDSRDDLRDFGLGIKWAVIQSKASDKRYWIRARMTVECTMSDTALAAIAANAGATRGKTGKNRKCWPRCQRWRPAIPEKVEEISVHCLREEVRSHMGCRTSDYPGWAGQDKSTRCTTSGFPSWSRCNRQTCHLWRLPKSDVKSMLFYTSTTPEYSTDPTQTASKLRPPVTYFAHTWLSYLECKLWVTVLCVKMKR